jgi:flagellar hook protein FlgE
MSLFGALTTGVSGMNAQSRSMGNISENLANTQTTGYKRVDTRFSHLVTNSSARFNLPGGVVATPSYQNNVQGTLLSTQSTTDLAITGGGFFAVADNPGAATTSYSRRGDFALNKDGYLVNGSGQFLRGWEINNPEATSGFIADTSAANPIRIDASPVPASATGATSATALGTGIDYIANLPSNAADGSNFTSSIQVFDQFGNTNTVNLTWTKVAATPNTWDLAATLTDETNTTTALNIDGAATAQFVFNDTTNAGTLATINGASAVNSDGNAFVSLGDVFGTTGNVDINFGGAFNATSGMTQFSDQDAQVSVRSLVQDGFSSGQFRDLSINDDGYITANYTNGTTRTLYQIPLASFPAPNALQRLDLGAFAATLESGQPTLNAAGRGGTGSLTGSALEGSNVDVADEFSKLIITQRIFSANARSITTSDQMLEEVVNLKR